MNNSKLNIAGKVLAYGISIPLALVIAGVTIVALVSYGVYLVELATR